MPIENLPFVETGAYSWEGEPNVKQVLIFSCPSDEKLADSFKSNKGYKNYKEIDNRDVENNLGAIFKIRAVKNGDNLWEPVIRSGTSGVLLYSSSGRLTYTEALDHCRYVLGLE